MQLYKGMDIGTAKLSLDQRRGIPHHLLDLVDVSTDVNVAWYQEQARSKIGAADVAAFVAARAACAV